MVQQSDPRAMTLAWLKSTDVIRVVMAWGFFLTASQDGVEFESFWPYQAGGFNRIRHRLHYGNCTVQTLLCQFKPLFQLQFVNHVYDRISAFVEWVIHSQADNKWSIYVVKKSFWAFHVTPVQLALEPCLSHEIKLYLVRSWLVASWLASCTNEKHAKTALDFPHVANTALKTNLCLMKCCKWMTFNIWHERKLNS